MMTSLMPVPKQQYFDSPNGRPLAGGKVYTYAAGTTTPKATYTDSAGTTPQTNPIILNARGEPDNPIYWDGAYKVVLKDAAGSIIYTVDNYKSDPFGIVAYIASVASTIGSSLMGFIQAGVGAVARTVQAKLRDIFGVKDYGAVVDGVTDDTTAIAATRTAAQAGGTIVYGGKTHAIGFYENLAPLAMEWIKGLPTAYATDVVSSKPVVGGKLFNGTPTAGAGYAGYLMRMDGYTKTGVDVASTAVGLFSMQSYSTNSSGANFNNTSQVALVANSSAMDAASSASVEAFNAIAYSAYTGALPQMVIGVESDVGSLRAPGWFGDASKTFGVAYSAVLASGTQDFSAAFACDTASASMAFLHGFVASGLRNTGFAVVRNGAIVPDTGVLVTAASTFGVYIGAKNRFNFNPGSIASYTYKPTIGLALGQEGATSSNSHKLRLISTDAGSAELDWDIYSDPFGEILFDYGGVNKVSIGASGAYLVQGNQIIGARQAGFTAMSGTANKVSAFDTSSVTLVQLAERVKALQDAMATHGLIGS